MAGRGGGRGRGLTLPAWMTKAGLTSVPSPGTVVPGLGAAAAVAAPSAAVIGGLQAERRPAAMPAAVHHSSHVQASASTGMGSRSMLTAAPRGAAPSFVPPSRQPAAAAAKPVYAPPAQQPGSSAKDWSEHKAPDGRSYYYNSVTKQSTYDRPAVMPKPVVVAPAAVAPVAAAAAAAPAAKAPAVIPPCKWKAYDHNGKTYYSDGKTSLWDKPEELKQHEAAVAKAKAAAEQAQSAAAAAANAAAAAEADAEAEATAAAAKRSKKREDKPAVDISAYTTPAQKKDAFLALLLEEGVSSAHKWVEIERACSEDPRWGLLKKGEKRQTTTEYQNQKRKDEAKEERQRARKAKDAFLKMLATNFDIDAHTRWAVAKDILASDPRYQNVTEEYVREEIFNEFVDELDKRDREEEMKRSSQARDAFNDLLNSANARGLSITSATKWQDVSMALHDMAEFTRNPLLKELHERAKMEMFSDHIKALAREEEVQREREREEKRREDAQRRTDFEQYLRDRLHAGKITADTKWKDLRQEIENEPEYRAIEKQGPTTARDVFDLIVEELRKQFRDDKRIIDALTHDAAFIVLPETTQAEFEAALLETEVHNLFQRQKASASDNGSTANGASTSTVKKGPFRELLDTRKVNVDLTFKIMMDAAVITRREQEYKRSRQESAYKELLEDNIYRSDQVSITWEAAKPKLHKRGAGMLELPEDAQIKLFDAHMAKLTKIMADKAERLDKLKAERDAKRAALGPVSATSTATSTAAAAGTQSSSAAAAHHVSKEDGEIGASAHQSNHTTKDSNGVVADGGRRGSDRKRRSSSPGRTQKRGRSRSVSSSRDDSRSRSSSRTSRHRRRSSRSRSRRRSRSRSGHRRKHKSKRSKHKHKKRSKRSRSRSGSRSRKTSSKKTRRDSAVEEGEILPAMPSPAAATAAAAALTEPTTTSSSNNSLTNDANAAAAATSTPAAIAATDTAAADTSAKDPSSSGSAANGAAAERSEEGSPKDPAAAAAAVVQAAVDGDVAMN